MPFFLFLLPFSFLIFLASSESFPAIVAVYDYSPNQVCDLENPFYQSAFSGPDYILTQEIVDSTGWNETKYMIEYFCICCHDAIYASMYDGIHGDKAFLFAQQTFYLFFF